MATVTGLLSANFFEISFYLDDSGSGSGGDGHGLLTSFELKFIDIILLYNSLIDNCVTNSILQEIFCVF